MVNIGVPPSVATADRGTGLGAVTVRKDCDEARPPCGSARLLMRPAVRWARPVPATPTTNPSQGQRRQEPANELFGSVAVTGTTLAAIIEMTAQADGKHRRCLSGQPVETSSTTGPS